MGTDAAMNSDARNRQPQSRQITEWRMMMKRITKIATGVGMALTLGLATAVLSAQPNGFGPGPGMGMGMGPMGQGRMGHGMGHGMGHRVNADPAAAESRLAALKSELKISAAQESAWNAFAVQTKQRAEAMQASMKSAQGSAQATAPERMDLHNQMMKTRLEQMEKTTTAFKGLYAVLSAEQKALADQRFGMMGGRGMGFNRPAQ